VGQLGDVHISESNVEAAAALDLKRATAALTEEQEVNLNGKRFCQVTVNRQFSPTEGMQLTRKWLLLHIQTGKSAYNLGLITVLGYYEQHRPILEQMARSFAYIE
jgi:hypothetical protein